MNRKSLGKTGLMVSRLCLGTLTFSPIQSCASPDEAAELLIYARDCGINILDTAEFYENYAHIKAAQKAIGDMLVVTKCHAYDLEGAKRSLDLALAATGRSIDIMMLHEQESEWTLRGHAQALAYFYRQKENGTIRAVGISTHFVRCAAAAAEMDGIDVIEAICNIKGLGIADGTQQQMNEALLRAHENGKGIIAMKALGGGHLRGDAKHAIQSVLALPFVDTIAIGMQSKAEIDYNASLFGIERSDLLTELNAQPRKLHIASWCTGCGMCAARCQSGALSVSDGKTRVDESKCVLCGYCAPACKEFCIKVY